MKDDKEDKSKSTTEKIRCNSCGGVGHKSEECLHKEKGVRCLKCNKFFECNTPKPTNGGAVASLLPDTMNMLHTKWVSIFGVQLLALLDIGSYVNIVREDVYHKIVSPGLQFLSKTLTGFGGHSIKVLLHKNLCNTPFHTIQIEIVISQDLLQIAVLISSGVKGIKITKLGVNRPAITNIKLDDNPNNIDIGEDASSEAKIKIEMLVNSYHPTKNKQADVRLKILVTNENLIAAPPRRLPFAERELVQSQVDALGEHLLEFKWRDG